LWISGKGAATIANSSKVESRLPLFTDSQCARHEPRISSWQRLFYQLLNASRLSAERQERTHKQVQRYRRIRRLHLGHPRLAGSKALSHFLLTEAQLEGETGVAL
jgi:hypothetical protein